MALNPELLALLACPVCRGELEPVDNESGLECPACGLVFPVRDNIPIMLQEEAIRKDGLFAFLRCTNRRPGKAKPPPGKSDRTPLHNKLSNPILII